MRHKVHAMSALDTRMVPLPRKRNRLGEVDLTAKCPFKPEGEENPREPRLFRPAGIPGIFVQESVFPT